MILRDKFPCDQCGECCRHVDDSVPNRGGVCVYLDGNRCSIYESRPDVCNVDRMYEDVCGMMTWDEWVEINVNACKKLKVGN